MLQFEAEQIAQFVNGRISVKGTDKLTRGVAVDSRLVTKNDIFFALKGEVTDGHCYLKNAAGNGASVLVVSKEDPDLSVYQIVVEDTFKALQDLARAYIKMFPIPYIAITGSSGKTTTKDITAAILSQKYRVLKTKGNLNSTTGVPLTIFDLSYEHEIGVIEISMSHPGEILGNADIVRPETAVITNVGLCHIEFLKTQENIFKAKSEILTYLTADDTAIVNSDDAYLQKIRSKSFKLIGVGIEHGDLKAEHIINKTDHVEFSVKIDGKAEKFTFSVPGNHNVINCLCAVAVGLKYGLTPDEIRTGLAQFIPSKNRMEIVKINDITLINDTYNANPDSMKAALNVLCHLSKGRKIAVLSDMYELGGNAPELHKMCGYFSADKKIDLLLTTGDFGYNYQEGFNAGNPGGVCTVFDSKDEIADYLKQNLLQGDTVLFKASRGMELEKLFLSVKENLSK